MNFIRDHFDKLLISFFLLTFIGICTYFAIKGIDAKAFDWAANAFGTFLGLLGGLITGVAIGRAQARNGNPPTDRQ